MTTEIVQPAVTAELGNTAVRHMAAAARLAMLQDQQKAFRKAHRHEMAQHEDGQAADAMAVELRDQTKGAREEIRELRAKARAYADGLEVGKALARCNAQVIGLRQRVKTDLADEAIKQALMPFMGEM